MNASRISPVGFGAALVVAGILASVVPNAQGESINQRLKSIIVPKVEIEDAPLEHAIDYLRIVSAGSADDKLAGINFVLKDPDGELAQKKITLELTKVPLDVVLRYVAMGAGATYRTDHHAIVLAKREFLHGSPGVLRDPPGDTKPVVDSLRGTILPEFSVEDARLEDAVDVLRSLAAAKSRRTNFVIYPQKEPAQSTPGQGGEAGAEAVTVEQKETTEKPERRFTLNLKNVPLGTALTYVCELGGVHFTAHRNAVAIGNLEDILSRSRSRDTGRTGFQTGGSTLGKKLGSLVIANVDLDSVTLDQALELVRVEAMNAERKAGVATPVGINIINMVKEDDVDEQKRLTLKLTNIPAWDYMGYVTRLTDTEFRIEPTAIVVSSRPKQDIVDANGRPKPDPLQLPAPGGGFNIPIVPATPGDFAMRKIGSSMSVQPVVSSDGRTIDLGISVEHSEFEGFVDYGNGIRLPLFGRGGP